MPIPSAHWHDHLSKVDNRLGDPLQPALARRQGASGTTDRRGLGRERRVIHSGNPFVRSNPEQQPGATAEITAGPIACLRCTGASPLNKLAGPLRRALIYGVISYSGLVLINNAELNLPNM